jgi:hypothetical protein
MGMPPELLLAEQQRPAAQERTEREAQMRSTAEDKRRHRQVQLAIEVGQRLLGIR